MTQAVWARIEHVLEVEAVWQGVRVEDTGALISTPGTQEESHGVA